MINDEDSTDDENRNRLTLIDDGINNNALPRVAITN